MYNYFLVFLLIFQVTKLLGNEINIDSIKGLKIPKSEKVNEILINKCIEMGLKKAIITDSIIQKSMIYYHVDFDFGFIYFEFKEEKNSFDLINAKLFDSFYMVDQKLAKKDYKKMKRIEDKYIPIILEIGKLEIGSGSYIEKLVDVINHLLEFEQIEIVKILHLLYCLNSYPQLDWAFKDPEKISGKFYISKNLPIELAQYTLFLKEFDLPPQILINYKNKEVMLPRCFIFDDLPIVLFDGFLCSYSHSYFGMLFFNTDKRKTKLKKPEKKDKEYIIKLADTLYNENKVKITTYYSAVLFREPNLEEKRIKGLFLIDIQLYFFNGGISIRKWGNNTKEE